jgi:Integrase core domain
MDNVFIERLWRSLKHEEVYLKGYADAREARVGIGQWLAFYNELRPHQALGHAMPMAVWRTGVGRYGAGSAVDMPLRSYVRFQGLKLRFFFPPGWAWLREENVAVQGRRRDRWTSVDQLSCAD